MRVIRFRIWDGGRMLEWSHLYPHYHALLLGMMNDEKDEDSSFALMQYTGLKDKNGKEIYEGDVVEGQEYYRSVVSFDEGSFTLKAIEVSKEPTLARWLVSQFDITVIGNVYENPELLNHVDTTN